jgi:hypothetical protein
MWHLAGTRWRCSKCQLGESRRDDRGERGGGGRISWVDQQSPRGQQGGIVSMTLVQGHHMLLWQQSEWNLMIYVIV